MKLKLRLTKVKKDDNDNFVFEVSKGRKSISALLSPSSAREIITYIDRSVN
jgi:hypothetical protein